MSAFDPSTLPLSRAPTNWEALLDDLVRRVRPDDETTLPAAWTLHAWASEQLGSAAIRIDGSEGLLGPPPARWRVLAHVDDDGGIAVAVLDGRAPLHADNVLASILAAPERSPIITVRGPAPVSTPTLIPVGDDAVVRPGIADPRAALPALVDLILGRCARVSGSAAAIPAALRLAAALALGQRGGALACSPPRRRGGPRRPRAFVATREPTNLRRQLAVVEAALRKRR